MGPCSFFTARVAEEDTVKGCSLGADDYIRKPFGTAKLRAKVDAHLRREQRERTRVLSFGGVRFDLGAKEGSVGGTAAPLPPTECEVCELLARRHGQVLSRAQIREGALGWDSDVDDSERFSAETLERGCERFFRGDDSRPHGHCGLGLHIASEALKANGGELLVPNREDAQGLAKGTHIVLRMFLSSKRSSS